MSILIYSLEGICINAFLPLTINHIGRIWKKLFMRLDLGKTELKIVLFNTNGNLQAVNSQEYVLIMPKVNCLEEEPKAIGNHLKMDL